MYDGQYLLFYHCKAAPITKLILAYDKSIMRRAYIGKPTENNLLWFAEYFKALRLFAFFFHFATYQL